VQALDGCSLSVARGWMPGSSVAGRIDALGLLHSGPRLDRRAAWRLTREA
jgi:hypothetical protein